MYDSDFELNLICLHRWNRHPTPLQISILSHELLHAVLDVLRRRGVMLCKESDETFTYTLESWTRTILESMKRT